MPLLTALSPADLLFTAFAFTFGAVVGSFLNVCIYRLPRGMSVHTPARSFCPHCRRQIAWYHNLPLVGWLWLRGRCAACRAPISVRYPLVELLTAVLFAALWLRTGSVRAVPFGVLAALLVVATFIDLEFLIIPDEITWGGVGAGLTAGLLVPGSLDQTTPWGGLAWSAVGAVAGYGLLWAVVELGKLAFGRKRVALDPPEEFTWHRVAADDDAELRIGAETDRWSELFQREKDQLVMECERLTLAGHEHQNVRLRCYYDRVLLGAETYPLQAVESFAGRVREFVFPREAMGMGDVKLLAAIGAFLGWPAVLFTVVAGSVLGSVVGVGVLALGGHRARSVKLPFGPYLAAGALLWMFTGPELVALYLSWPRRGEV